MSAPRNPNEDMTARYGKAMKTLEATLNRIAGELTAGKIGWHGDLAVKTVLLEAAEAALSDNFHDDPDFYQDVVDRALG
jgi:hypothetical protein